MTANSIQRKSVWLLLNIDNFIRQAATVDKNKQYKEIISKSRTTFAKVHNLY